MSKSSLPIAARLRRRVPVFVCRKCLKRTRDSGDLRKALKKELKATGHAQGIKPRVLMTGCFGLCPRRAIVAASGATLARGETLVIAEPRMADAAARALLADRAATTTP